MATYIKIKSNDVGIVANELISLYETFTTPFSMEFSDGSLVYIKTARDLSYLLAGLKLFRSR